MDQNSSNGSGKTNWREKLGIGTNAKEIPKISDEFKPAGPAANSSRPQRVEPKIVARPAPRAPHPVAKPAPMAPRPAQVASPSPPPPPEPKSESLAERLKSQRQAAERLAEQRIGAVRDSVKETKPPVSAKAADDPKSKTAAGAPSDAPKFSFSEEELASAKADTARDAGRKYGSTFQTVNTAASPAVPPLIPPRPALGGEKPLLPPAKQEPIGYSGAVGPQTGGYRPLDPPPYQPQRTLPPATPPRSGYGEAAADLRQPPAGRREAFDSTRRPPPPARLGVETGDPALPIDDARGRRPVPQRPRRPSSYDDDLGEVFEDEDAAPPPRRRAKAQDYSQAYREYEDSYEDDERRSSGPWLLLFALLALAALAFGGIWYYSKFMAPQGTQQTGETVPVVPAPKEPDKTVQQPESQLGAINPEPAPAVKNKKLIYDRILGDQAIEGGTIVPTEEAPTQVQPPSNQSQQAVPAAGPPENQGLQPSQGQAVEPPQPNAPANTQTIDPAVNGGAGQSEPLPLPVPPTPGSSPAEGSLVPANGQRQSAVAMAQPTVSPASTTSQETALPAEPVTATPNQTTVIGQQPAVQQQEPSAELIEGPAAPAKQKARAADVPAKSKKKAKAVAQKAKSKEPVVLVPPPDAGSDQAAAAPQTPADANSGSFFGNGKEESGRPGTKQDDKILSAGRTNFSAKQPEQNLAADTQVASVEPAEPQAASKPEQRDSTSSGGGYVAQLASFRSEAEALSEFDRLRGKHSNILGSKSPRVSKGTVGGTTRYRLGVGPLASKGEASKLCNSLIASGERDCIVRQQ